MIWTRDASNVDMHSQPTNKMASIRNDAGRKRTWEGTVEIVTEFANIGMGICWFNGMDVWKARHYTSYIVTCIMVFLEVPVQYHQYMARYAIDGTVSIYYFSNGELRNQPSIYADKIFRNLTRRQ